MAAYAHESITVSKTAVGLTESNISKAINLFGREVSLVTCTLETATIRYTWDGTTPTSSVGHLLNVGDKIFLDKDDAIKFKAIRTGTTNGVLKVTYAVYGTMG